MSSAKSLIGISKPLRKKSRMKLIRIHVDSDSQSGRRTGDGVGAIASNSQSRFCTMTAFLLELNYGTAYGPQISSHEVLTDNLAWPDEGPAGCLTNLAFDIFSHHRACVPIPYHRKEAPAHLLDGGFSGAMNAYPIENYM